MCEPHTTRAAADSGWEDSDVFSGKTRTISTYSECVVGGALLDVVRSASVLNGAARLIAGCKEADDAAVAAAWAMPPPPPPCTTFTMVVDGWIARQG